MRVLVLLLVGIAAVAAVRATSSHEVKIQTCQDPTCGLNCKTTTVEENKCVLDKTHSSTSMKYTCGKTSNFCVNASLFDLSDTQCADFSWGHIRTVSDVCGSCQKEHYTMECGGLPTAMYFQVNCTDNACNKCSPTIVPFYKCTYLPPLGNIIVFGVFQCDTVTVETFSGSTCTGSATSTELLVDGRCSEGTTVTC